jgi:subtilase family serine protease
MKPSWTEKLAKSIVPGSLRYDQFLKPAEFESRYAPSPEQVGQVHAHGDVASLSRAFQTEIHQYLAESGKSYYAPRSPTAAAARVVGLLPPISVAHTTFLRMSRELGRPWPFLNSTAIPHPISRLMKESSSYHPCLFGMYWWTA